MKSIFRYIFSAGLCFLLGYPAISQDTLRTYGPRFGIDVARFVYIFADPSELGTEFSMDLEVYENIFPVVELGYNRISQQGDIFDYTSGGPYIRIGADYNLLPITDRSIHHSIFVGFRYGISTFAHSAENINVASEYWGDLFISSYDNTLAGQWLEIVGGIRAEVAKNFFLGWMVRYKVLLNPDMDPLVAPQMVPGYGRGTLNRGFGISYGIFYKIPLLKR
jgi:hypothetical protein